MRPYLCVTAVMSRILDALETSGDLEASDIADIAYTSRQTLIGSGYLRQLERAGLIRISRWQRNYRGLPTPIYSVTPGRSRPRPRPTTSTERSAKWYRSVRLNPEEQSRKSALKELVSLTERRATK